MWDLKGFPKIRLEVSMLYGEPFVIQFLLSESCVEVHGEQLQGMVLEYNRVSTPQISLEKVRNEWVDHVASL